MDLLRIGFVGVGFMGQLAHLANYTGLPGCGISAIAEVRNDLGKAVAARYGVSRVYNSHLDMMADCPLDAIVAAQPYKHHAALIPDILNAGIPVITEKPLALSVEKGEMLSALSREKGVLHMVGYHKRSDPAVEYAMGIINDWKKSGEYGDFRYVRITMPPGDWTGGMQGAISSEEPYPRLELESAVPGLTPAESKAYDIFVNYYIHQVNMLRHILGEAYELSFADPSGAVLAARSASGICGIIEMAPYRNTTQWNESILVCFETGYIKIDLPAPLVSRSAGKITIMRDNGHGLPSFETPVMPNISAMKNQALNFIAAVKGERKAPCDSTEAVEDLRIAREYIRMMRVGK